MQYTRLWLPQVVRKFLSVTLNGAVKLYKRRRGIEKSRFLTDVDYILKSITETRIVTIKYGNIEPTALLATLKFLYSDNRVGLSYTIQRSDVMREPLL